MKDFIKKYIRPRDLIIFISFLLISHWCYLLLTWLYPTLGEPSFQWMYKVVFGITRVIAIIGASYIILAALKPEGFKYFENKLYKTDIENLNPWQRTLYFTLLYFFFILVTLLSVITM